MSTSGLWACGTLGKVHGLRGELYLNLCPEGLNRLQLGARFFVAATRQTAGGAGELRPCEVARVGGDDRRPLLRLDLAANREQAIALQGMELLACGGELDGLPFYRVGDLIGLRVETAAGSYLGEVSDVLETPAHEVLEVRAPDGTSLLVPLVDELVTVAEDEGVARVVDGLLDVPAAAEGPADADEAAAGDADADDAAAGDGS